MCWNETTDSYGCFHIGREHSRTGNVNVFYFSNQSDESFQFHKAKTQASNKILALHHVPKTTAVTQKVDAVALKAQKTVLSTSLKTQK